MPYNKKSELLAYTDTSFADTHDPRSTEGHLVYFAISLIAWKPTKQSVVAKSSTEAEYMGQEEACSLVMWLRQQLEDIGYPQKTTVIWADNQGAIKLTKNPEFHYRTKHIRKAYHFQRQFILKGDLSFKYVPSDQMTADALTKALCRGKNSYGLTVWEVSAIYTMWKTLDPIGSGGYPQHTTYTDVQEVYSIYGTQRGVLKRRIWREREGYGV